MEQFELLTFISMEIAYHCFGYYHNGTLFQIIRRNCPKEGRSCRGLHVCPS